MQHPDSPQFLSLFHRQLLPVYVSCQFFLLRLDYVTNSKSISNSSVKT